MRICWKFDYLWNIKGTVWNVFLGIIEKLGSVDVLTEHFVLYISLLIIHISILVNVKTTSN